MKSQEIREKFISFFTRRGHLYIPPSPLVSSDPTLLFVNAGMVQFKPYLLGEVQPPATRATNSQICFRTVDIEKVGVNKRSLTFFEMLGNWSFGDYWKRDAISFAVELLTQVYKIPLSRLWVTVFRGEEKIPEDTESVEIWKDMRIPESKIVKLGMDDNFWIGGPTGPCGPCTEIYYDFGGGTGCNEPECKPGCDCDRFLEIWNLVFMEYYKDEKGNFSLLPQKNVDTGAGLERFAWVLQEKGSVFETDLFLPIFSEIKRNEKKGNEKAERIIADHIRGIVFLISEGVLPSNVERGYICRRLLRRSIRYARMLELPPGFLVTLAQKTVELYKEMFHELSLKEGEIINVIQNEQQKFEKTLERGLKNLEKMLKKSSGAISGKDAFDLYQNFGFPLELTKEIVQEAGGKLDENDFWQEFAKHQEISRVGSEKKFGGIGKDPTWEATKLHTATHLLHSALRMILGEGVRQMGSDITPERLRFDFSFERKLVPEELKKIEDLVNKKIIEDLPVTKHEMKIEDALKSGALAFFKEKYPERVTVYEIGDFSKEICGGPHVQRTSQLGHFKIIKEESAGAGIRRIRAILE